MGSHKEQLSSYAGRSHRDIALSYLELAGEIQASATLADKDSWKNPIGIDLVLVHLPAEQI
jgi:hypothetical protein